MGMSLVQQRVRRECFGIEDHGRNGGERGEKGAAGVCVERSGSKLFEGVRGHVGMAGKWRKFDWESGSRRIGGVGRQSCV